MINEKRKEKYINSGRLASVTGSRDLYDPGQFISIILEAAQVLA